MEIKTIIILFCLLSISIYIIFRLANTIFIYGGRNEYLEKEVKKLTKKLNSIPIQYGGIGKSELELDMERRAKKRKKEKKIWQKKRQNQKVKKK